MKWVGRRRRGFTLMEAIVALAVFTVGMLGLSGAFSQIVHANAASRQRQTAALLAERKLTQLRMTDPRELTGTNGTFEPPFEDYTWEIHVRADARDLAVMDVWVEVAHRSGAGVKLWTRIGLPNDL